MNGYIDPKAAAGTAGAAAATLLWVLLAAFVPAIGDMATETLATVTGATATLFGFALAYLVPNAASPIKDDGIGIEQSIEEMTSPPAS